MREELSKAMEDFSAIGACGIVMDVNTGEVLAMVSLPDYDANNVGSSPAEERFNRAVTGMYEPGSTFKLQTAAMALDCGIVHIWDEFDAAPESTSAGSPSPISRASIAGLSAGGARLLLQPRRGAHRAGGGRRTPARLAASMGMFNRVGIELPEAGRPISRRRRTGRRS